jgi:hypothetical protein
MAELPPFICEEKFEMTNNNGRVPYSASFFYCSVCDSSFRKPRMPEVHCAGPVHVKNVTQHREKKEERKRRLEKQIEEMRIKFQEREESIAEQQGRDAQASIQKEKEKTISAWKHTV